MTDSISWDDVMQGSFHTTSHNISDYNSKPFWIVYSKAVWNTWTCLNLSQVTILLPSLTCPFWSMSLLSLTNVSADLPLLIPLLYTFPLLSRRPANTCKMFDEIWDNRFLHLGATETTFYTCSLYFLPSCPMVLIIQSWTAEETKAVKM